MRNRWAEIPITLPREGRKRGDSKWRPQPAGTQRDPNPLPQEARFLHQQCLWLAKAGVNSTEGGLASRGSQKLSSVLQSFQMTALVPLSQPALPTPAFAPDSRSSCVSRWTMLKYRVNLVWGCPSHSDHGGLGQGRVGDGERSLLAELFQPRFLTPLHPQPLSPPH